MTQTTETTVTEPGSRVGELLAGILTDSAVFPVEIVVRGRTGSRVVDVYVDSEDPIGSDDLATISRELGAAMDAEDLIRGSYRLNVSTPGADRPLQSLRQFPKHVGRTLCVRWTTGGEEDRTETGRLTGIDGEFVVLETRGGDTHRIPFESVIEATVQLPW